ncbi:dynamin family protein [Bacillus sp. CHD6a]|uniref:dynamin family protein n=1 Tax=Bacillus sp. CHD6a TaxID=1643452 RepID=UPI0009E7A5DE|nr:dynamin family protein [Bacillus sp. CHD6a]
MIHTTKGTEEMGTNNPKQQLQQKEQETSQLQAKLQLILEKLDNHGDLKSARKVAELLHKHTTKELSIAFCGHFSAGKSSFINEILEEAILPASPIPTSANVVQIRSGEELAHVHFFEGESLEILPPVSFEHVKAYCKDGDQVESVDYQFPFEKLPSDMVILDTPGVDSTDDAHRISTESALHLADVIFYVMDYNHVQSEVNLKFIKDLQDKEKKIYLIVNQIDKHREEEIPFSTYNERIMESFGDWGIIPTSIYFTSLKDTNHSLNDLPIVKETIQILRQDKLEILPKTIERALIQVMEEHKDWQMDQKAEEIEILEQTIRSIEDLPKDVSERLNERKNKLSIIQSESAELKEDLINQTKRILENANITPFEMRELAERYLESQQKGFKVGMLFSGKKTQEEREQRSAAFRSDLEDRVKTQVEKFIHEHIFSFLKEQNFYSPSIFEKVQELTVPLTEEFVFGHVKPGAGYTGNAVLHYTKDLAHSIKLDYQKQVQRFMEGYFEKIDTQMQENTKELKVEVDRLEAVHHAQEAITQLHIKLEQEYEQLNNILISTATLTEQSKRDNLITKYLNRSYKKVRGDELPSSLRKQKSAIQTQGISSTAKNHNDPEIVVKGLIETSTSLKEISGFGTIVDDLKKRAGKIETQTFTVALFGAFSAGKSSLANALFGEKVLPVSPNPTTASINKISPVTKVNPHGSVNVQMKTVVQLLQDVQQALQLFNTDVRNLEEAVPTIKSIITNNEHLELDANKKTHLHFLKAFLTGWEEMKTKLGTLQQVSLNEFEAYVAKEEKSCFVEWIEVFYDCPFTRQGLTLVDTPGADSINARHTDVSFDYIKNADAILFVTYYQHAFSKADREFLIQLGRVKDAFAMDKMFFLVNAADLANNEEELELVCDYVRDQLNAYGIRHPRLYPVSSLLALKEKENRPFEHTFLKSSLMNDFEQAFNDFIQSDLVEMSLHAAQSDLNKAVDLFEHFVQQAKLGSEEKERLQLLYASNKMNLEAQIIGYETVSFYTLLEQEINELVYYIKQRTLLRFSDFFKESFNPAVIREDGRNIKAQLINCLHELVTDISHNLSQEVRATTVRTENFIRKTLESWQKELESEAQQLEAQLSLRVLEAEGYTTFKVNSSFPSISPKLEKQTLGYYRNSKAFFEKNEKQKMALFLEEQLSPLMDSYLKESAQKLTDHYKNEMQISLEEVKKYILRQLEDYFGGMQAALEQEQDIPQLEEVLARIKKHKK